eukprot:2796452-Amphidinium_carterae.1
MAGLFVGNHCDPTPTVKQTINVAIQHYASCTNYDTNTPPKQLSFPYAQDRHPTLLTNDIHWIAFRLIFPRQEVVYGHNRRILYAAKTDTCETFTFPSPRTCKLNPGT